MPKWAANVLHAIFSPLSKSRRKRNPRVTNQDRMITGPVSSSQPELNDHSTNPIITGPFSSSQPELDSPVLDQTPGRFPSTQPMPDVIVILLDIPFPISETRGLLDPLSSVSEALDKVLSAAKVCISLL